MKRRFIIELGSGADLHGADMTKAAARAVRDAVSHACLCGIVDILGRTSFEGIYVHAEVRVPEPDEVDVEKLKALIPIGEKEIVVEKGGMRVPGLEVACFAKGSSDIVMACAALTVYVEDKPEQA